MKVPRLVTAILSAAIGIAVPVAAWVFFTTFDLNFNAAARDVVIFDGDKILCVTDHVGTVEDALDRARVTLGHAEFEVTEEDDATLVVISRYPAITVLCDGEESLVAMKSGTVAEALAELGITLGELDEASESLETAIFDGMRVEVCRVTVEDKFIESEIEFGTQYMDDPDLEKGKTELVSEGKKGVLTTTYRYTYRDGVLTDFAPAGEEVTTEPVDEVYRVGAKEPEPEPKPQTAATTKPTAAATKPTTSASTGTTAKPTAGTSAAKPTANTGAGTSSNTNTSATAETQKPAENEKPQESKSPAEAEKPAGSETPAENVTPTETEEPEESVEAITTSLPKSLADNPAISTAATGSSTSKNGCHSPTCTVDTATQTITTADGTVYYYSKSLTMKATAYTYDANPKMNTTASGVPVQVGVVSALPSTLPQGTKVYIVASDGSWEYGFAIVGDKPGRDIIDLFMETEKQCLNFGVKSASVYIVG